MQTKSFSIDFIGSDVTNNSYIQGQQYVSGEWEDLLRAKSSVYLPEQMSIYQQRPLD